MLDEKMRKLAIGGSEIGAILGVDEHRDGFAVWASKRGDLRRLDDNEVPVYMKAGHFLEKGIIEWYSDQTGRAAIYDNKTKLHPTRPYMVYTPDALCRFERRGVDAKAVRWDQRHKWGESVEEIPDRIIAQCWWYMAAMDYDAWDVAALIGGQDLRVYTVERDHAIEAVMLEQAEEFYRRYLVGDEKPPIQRASDEAVRYLKEHYPKNRGPMIKVGADEYDFLEEYSQLRISEDEITDRRKWSETVIKERIADAEGIEWPQGRITYRATKDGTTTDWAGLAKRLMQTMTDKEREVYTHEFTSFKPGYRALRWDYYDKPDPKAVADPEKTWVTEP